MRISVLSIFIILCFGVFALAQQPVIIQMDVENIGQVRADCPDLLAGNARMTATTDGGKLIDVDDLVLCAGEGVIVSHAGDYNLDQDPDPATTSGIWYAVFTEEPTTTGVISQATLAGLDHIVMLDNNTLIFARADDSHGNMTIINDGSFLQAAGLTGPQQLWFAPITIHNIEGNAPNEYFEEDADNCIHINSTSAFSITYLNELEFSRPTPGATSGTITVSGGMPEFNNSDYTVTLTNLTTNEIIPLSSDNGTDFAYGNLSDANAYRLTISDNVDCSTSTIINFRSGEPLEVHIPDTVTTPDSEICIPFTLQNFHDIATFSFVLRWNPAILEYTDISYKNPALSAPGSGSQLNHSEDFVDEGNLVLIWFANDLKPIEIPNDSTLMEVCFTAIGDPGQKSDVILSSYKGTLIDFTDTSSSVNFTVYPGSVTIVPPTTLDFSYQACGSGSPYDLNIQVFGGRGPFEYALDGSASNSGSSSESQFTLSGLNQGDYTLRITDADGNEQIKNIHISEINHPSVAIFPNDCASDPNGMAFLEDPIEGNYQIEWTYNDEKFYNVDTLRNLAGGEVFFSIINENNCPSPVRSVTIPNNGITVSHTVLDNPNCDGTPGSVRFQISGGTAPYTIFYSGNRVEVPSTIELEIYRESESFNISDDNGCAINEIVTSTITGGETFRLTDSTVTDLNCENTENGGNGRMGQFDGRIATSFTSAILYHADGGQVHGTKFIAMGQRIRAERLEPGDYYWEINGTCPGNPTTIPFTIQDLVSNPPTINETITAIGCGDGNGLGSISLEVFPERNNYIFEWSNGESTAAVTDLSAGDYTVTVTDPETLCSVEATYSITEGVAFNKIEVTLPCDADTMANVGVSIRDDYESILWDSGETTEIIQVNSPGYYAFSISPSDPDCPAIRDSIYIPSATGGVQITGFNPVLIDDCGNPQGLFVVYLNEPIANYGFSWDNEPPILGLNEFRVYDGNMHNLKIYIDDCVAVDTNFNFVFNNIITFDTATFDITCYGEDDGQIIVSASGGGSNNFRYEFEGSGRLDFFGEYRNLAPGEYTVRVEDQTPSAGSPCPDVNLTFTIREPDPFIVTVDTTQVTPPSCAGDWDGSIQLVVEGGNPGTKNIRYNFSGGANRTNQLRLDSLRASNYQIRVEDSLGCIANVEYLLEDPDPINFEIPPIEEPMCAGQTTTLIISSATGGTGMDYQYSVDGGVPVPLGDPLDILAGEHQITVYDGNLCNVTNAVVIPEPEPILVSFNQPDTLLVSLGENIELAAEVNGTNPITDYIWTPTPPDSLNTREILQFSAVQNLTVSLDVIDSRGCTGSNEIFVLVRKTRDIGIPNAFSPNGDGHNDLLTVIPGPAVQSIQKFQIFDRYGTLVWEESNISPAQAQITGWDGTYKGKPAMVDVYVMLLRVEYIDGQVIQRIADVTLIK